MKKNRAIVVLLLTAIITVFLCYTAGVGIGPDRNRFCEEYQDRFGSVWWCQYHLSGKRQ